jgi:hypothetical protein
VQPPLPVAVQFPGYLLRQPRREEAIVTAPDPIPADSSERTLRSTDSIRWPRWANGTPAASNSGGPGR